VEVLEIDGVLQKTAEQKAAAKNGTAAGKPAGKPADQAPAAAGKG
jgi:hypothetical protein